MGYLTGNKMTKIIDHYDGLFKFGSQKKAEVFFEKLKNDCLTFIDKNNSLLFESKLDYSGESIKYLDEIYQEADKDNSYEKKYGIDKKKFQSILGIYWEEVHVRCGIALWAVERFFESDAYTLGIDIATGPSLRYHALKEIDPKQGYLYEQFFRYSKKDYSCDQISNELKYILTEMNNPEVGPDKKNSKGFLFRQDLNSKVKESFNEELIRYLKVTTDSDIISDTMFLVREQLMIFYNYELINAVLEKADKEKSSLQKYSILSYIVEIPKCKNVSIDVLKKLSTNKDFFVRRAAFQNLSSYYENKEQVFEWLKALLDNPKKEKDLEYIIYALGNIGDKRAIEFLEPYTKSSKRAVKNQAKDAIKLLSTNN
jgi:hypothetical protein